MTSLRQRLFLILVASTSLIWLCGVAWIYLSSRVEIEHQLDRRLMEAARMVTSLAAPDSKNHAAASTGVPLSSEPILGNGTYEHRLTCQVWSFDGHLVGRSTGAPETMLTETPSGFSNPMVDGELWRVFAMEDPVKGVRVLVGDSVRQREQLTRDLVRGLIVPGVLSLPLVALLIWVSIGRGLRPLDRATTSLASRDADNLTPLDVGRVPSEIRPLIDALNGLFGKVVAAREHERSFLAYAAHELRTPLAGLKTQVQVAAAAQDAQVRDTALRQTMKSVDRTARLVKQLLAISQLDARSVGRAEDWVNLEHALVDINRGIGRDLRPERVEIAQSLRGHSVAVDRELFDLAARNLTENALQLTPEDGRIRWSMCEKDGEARILIEDEGPGIPAEERELVLQRFYRGRTKSPTGSGLGLAIVTAALEQAGARLHLCAPKTGRGLRAEIILNGSRLRRDAA